MRHFFAVLPAQLAACGAGGACGRCFAPVLWKQPLTVFPARRERRALAVRERRAPRPSEADLDSSLCHGATAWATGDALGDWGRVRLRGSERSARARFQKDLKESRHVKTCQDTHSIGFVALIHLQRTSHELLLDWARMMSKDQTSAWIGWVVQWKAALWVRAQINTMPHHSPSVMFSPLAWASFLAESLHLSSASWNT